MVPTAQEIANKIYSELSESDKASVSYMSTGTTVLLLKAMKEFAKIHCEAQAKAIEESAYIVTKRDKFRNITSCKINRESIVTAYPLDKIK